MQYRPDIDGLRAFAVLFVTIFHINEALIPGGFVGVDMFFVISGYLITGTIARDVVADRFTFAEFYRRRIKRIFPAMLLVTGVTLVAGVALMLPQDVEALSWSALATILSAANIYFAYFLDTSYFAADSATVPLLHMWSLGVEEQFYLFWPVALLVLLKWPRAIAPALLVLIAASIALGEWMLGAGHFEWAYYMLPTRAFQLAAGGLLVFLPAWMSGRGSLSAAMVSAGAVLCTASAFILTGHTLYPGLNAVPVTLGTALIILGGSMANPISLLLTWTPLRWIGLISYSLYLWHWPVLAFQRYFTPELSIPVQVVSGLVMLGLAQISYSFVEQPCRKSQGSFRHCLTRQWAIPSAATAAAVALVLVTSGLGPWMWSDHATGLSTPVRAAYSYSFVCQAPRISDEMIRNKKCVLGNGQKPTVLLYGDSNAAHFVGAFREVATALGFSFKNLAHSACPPIEGEAGPFTSAKYRERCTYSHEIMSSVINDYDTIILAASWSSYEEYGKQAGVDFRKKLKSFVSILRAADKRVVLVGVIPRQPEFDRECVAKRTKVPFLECNASTPATEPAINAYLEDLAEGRDQVWYLDPYPALCSAGKCSAFVHDKPLYYDAGHLSLLGSKIVGEAWLRGEGADLPSLRLAFTPTDDFDRQARQEGP